MRLAYSARRKKNLKIDIQIMFLNRLGNLLEKNYTFKQSLQFLKYDPQFNDISHQFTLMLQKGNEIIDCFKFLNFHPYVISFMRLSNESGNLIEHIHNCKRILSLNQEIRKKLKDALKYPLFLIFFTIVIFIGINVYLLPTFQMTFNNLGQTHSMEIFSLIIQCINILFMIFLMTLILTTIYVLHLKRSPINVKIKVIEKIPVIRDYYKSLISMHFAYQLYALLDCGNNVREALHVLSSKGEIRTIQYLSSLIIQCLSKGHSLTEATNKIPIFQPELKWLIKRSDDQGTLTQDLQSYALILLDQLEERAKKGIVLIQPVIYVIVGLLVITIYALTLFPIYQLIHQI